MFKGPGCFENHRRVGVTGGSVCQTYSKCQKCGKVADDNPETHRCFMMPVKKKTKRKTRESDDEEE